MCFISGRRWGFDRTTGGVCSVYIWVAANSPAWLTRSALSKKSRCFCVRIMRGLFDVLLVVEFGRLAFSEVSADVVELGLNCCRCVVIRGARKVRYKGRIAAFWLHRVHLRIARVASILMKF